MNDEVMKGILSLMQGSIDNGRMSAELSLQLIQSIGQGIANDIAHMEKMILGIENVIEHLTDVISEVTVLLSEETASEVMKKVSEAAEEKVNRKESEQQVRSKYPSAYFYRPKNQQESGYAEFTLYIEETENELKFYLYDEKKTLIAMGATSDKSATPEMITNIALQKDVHQYYDCIIIDPDHITISAIIPNGRQENTAETKENENKAARDDQDFEDRTEVTGEPTEKEEVSTSQGKEETVVDLEAETDKDRKHGKQI